MNTRRRTAVRGALIALAVAAVVGLIVLGSVLLMRGSMSDALLAAGYVAGLYLALNLIVLAVGIWFKASDSWAVGAALATPVILAAIGFGYAAYRAVPT